MSFYGVLEMTGDEAQWRGLGRGLRSLLETPSRAGALRGQRSPLSAMSPFERITPEAPPFFVVQGVNDTLVEVQRGARLRRAVRRDRLRSDLLRRTALHPTRFRHLRRVRARRRRRAQRSPSPNRSRAHAPNSRPSSSRATRYRPPNSVEVDGEWLDAREAASRARSSSGSSRPTIPIAMPLTDGGERRAS